MAEGTCSVEGCDKPKRDAGMCGMHYTRKRRHGDPSIRKLPFWSHSVPAPERFWATVEKTDGCWLWTGGIRLDGYGRFYVGRSTLAHRFSYETLVGPIPDGLCLDHLCHNADPACTAGSACVHRRCVNPAHLAAVPLRENALSGKSVSAVNARKTHCKNGHPFDEANTYVHPKKGRACRICRAAHRRLNRSLYGREARTKTK